MIEKKEEEAQQAVDALNEERVAAMVNSAITSHAKRQASSFEKLLEEKLGKFAEALKPQASAPETSATAGESTEAKMLKQQIEEMRRSLDEEKKARAATEEKSRWDSARSTLRASLQKKGVRPELLDVAVGHLAQVTQSLRFDENGAPILGVKRSRMKGAPADENIFDVENGVDDWLKTDEAKPFLPPPPSLNNARQAPIAGRPAQRYEAAPTSDEERARRTAEMLQGYGVELER